MSKSKLGRQAGAETRTVYTGGAPRQWKKSVYGSTPKARVGGNSSSLFGKTISGCNPATHVIGAPRESKEK